MVAVRRRTFQIDGVRPLQGRLTPVVKRTYGTYLLVMSMALATIVATRFGGSDYQTIVDRYGLTAADWSWVDIESYGQLLSHAFIHSGAQHFLGNTLFLLLASYVFERRTSFRWTGAVFIVGVLASGLVHILSFSGDPHPLIGASGAVFALLGATWVVAGDYGFHLRVPIARRWFQLTLRRVLLVWVALQLWGLVQTSMSGSATPGIAYWGHLTGFVAGLAVAGLFLLVGAVQRDADAHPDLAPGYSGAGD